VFGTTPIEGSLTRGHRAAGIENFANLAVDLKIGGNGGDRDTELRNFLCRNGCGNLLKKGGAGDRRVEARLNFADDLAGFLECLLGNGIDLATNLLNFFFGNETRIEEAAREETTDGWVRIDFGVKGGLGKVRFVSLVVSVAAIADDIEDNVFMEFLAKFESQLDDGGGSQGIVSVDVKNRQTKSFAGSGTVAGGAGVIWQSSKCDLIIDDDVDGSARAVSFEAGKIDGFSDDALSDKSAVSMDQNGNYFFALYGVVPKALPGAGFSFHHRVDGLQVAGIGCKGKTDFFSMGGSDLIFIAEVVFHVPVT
jgi:hypothetical protein